MNNNGFYQNTTSAPPHRLPEPRRELRRPFTQGDPNQTEQMIGGLQDLSLSEQPQPNIIQQPPPSLSNGPGLSPHESGQPTTMQSAASKLSAEAAVFVPSWLKPEPAAPNPASDIGVNFPTSSTQESGIEDTHSYTLWYVNDTIQHLTLNPGKFDVLVTPFVTFLNSWITTEATHIETVNLIFEQSVMEQNFRYSGARLCNHLSHNLSPNLPGGTFRSLLLTRCNKELATLMVTSGSSDYRLCGFAFFMGELYSRLELQPANSEQGTRTQGFAAIARITLLAEGLLKLLSFMADNYDSEENMKNVCKILKMTGAILEDDVTLKPQLDELMMSLQALGQLAKHTPLIAHMMVNVVELRRYNWGRSSNPTPAPIPTAEVIQRHNKPIAASYVAPPSTTSTQEGHPAGGHPQAPPQGSHPQAPQGHPQAPQGHPQGQHPQAPKGMPNQNYVNPNEGVFYGPDGAELTAEESQFLHDQLTGLDNDNNDDPEDYDGDNSGVWSTADDREFDEEIQAEFEKFLNSE